MDKHALKILPKYFKELVECRKNFELRKKDRDYRIGDILELNEFDGDKYTGNSLLYEITYILNGGEYGLDKDYVILSIQELGMQIYLAKENYTIKETRHDYQGCLMDNFYDIEGKSSCEFNNWEDFKERFTGGFSDKNNFRNYDDTYNFVFRYDIDKKEDNTFSLELCIMLQRKGVYIHNFINNIDEKTLNTEVKEWLKGRCNYLKLLWNEFI